MPEVTLKMYDIGKEPRINETFNWLFNAKRRSTFYRKMYGKRAGQIAEIINHTTKLNPGHGSHQKTHIMIIQFKHHRIISELPDITVKYSIEFDVKDYGLRAADIKIISVDIDGMDLKGYKIENEMEFLPDGSIHIEDVEVDKIKKTVKITSFQNLQD